MHGGSTYWYVRNTARNNWCRRNKKIRFLSAFISFAFDKGIFCRNIGLLSLFIMTISLLFSSIAYLSSVPSSLYLLLKLHQTTLSSISPLKQSLTVCTREEQPRMPLTVATFEVAAEKEDINMNFREEKKHNKCRRNSDNIVFFNFLSVLFFLLGKTSMSPPSGR